MDKDLIVWWQYWSCVFLNCVLSKDEIGMNNLVINFVNGILFLFIEGVCLGLF